MAGWHFGVNPFKNGHPEKPNWHNSMHIAAFKQSILLW